MTWKCIVEIVQVVTGILTTLIAAIGVCVAYKTLLRTPVQEPEPDKAQAKEHEATVPSEVKVFETSKQTTLLRVTENGLECYLDDRRRGKRSGHQWTLTKSQTKEVLSNHDYEVYPGYRLHSGLFSIGPRRNWLYSKKLYPEPDLLKFDIRRLLETAST